jgi:hypothetical protein
VRHNVVGVGGNIVYTLRINGAASALTVTLAASGTVATDATHSAVVNEGDVLDLQVTKAVAITTSPTSITATLEVA